MSRKRRSLKRNRRIAVPALTPEIEATMSQIAMILEAVDTMVSDLLDEDDRACLDGSGEETALGALSWLICGAKFQVGAVLNEGEASMPDAWLAGYFAGAAGLKIEGTSAAALSGIDIDAVINEAKSLRRAKR